MEFHLFSIAILLHLVFLSGKVTKKTLQNRLGLQRLGLGLQEKKMLHNSAHLAHAVLMTMLGIMLIVTLGFMFVEMWVYQNDISNMLTSFIFAQFCAFLIGNIWYMGHVHEEESGKYRE